MCGQNIILFFFSQKKESQRENVKQSEDESIIG